MILFAMGVSVGKIKSSILVPSVSERNQEEMQQPALRSLHQEVEKDFKGDLLQLSTNIETSRKHHPPFEISYSGTFGADDPFTLLWLLELLRPYQNDADLGSWYARVTAAAQNKVDKVFKQPGRVDLVLDKKRSH